MRLFKKISLALSAVLMTLSNALAGDKSAASQEWRSYAEPLASIGERVAKLLPDPEDPLQRQELYRQLFSFISGAYWGLLYQDPDNPDFVYFGYEYAAPDADTIHSLTPIRGDGVYKISGRRGSALMVTFTIGAGEFYTRGAEERMQPNFGDYDLDTLHIGKDGRFEVILSQTRPAGYSGDWWHLDPKATNILARQRSYDWGNEIAGQLAIQRLDRPIRRPLKTAEQLAQDLRQVAVWAESFAKWNIEFINGMRRRGLVNQLEIVGFEETGGFQIQKYIQGLFDIQPDEALIYESEIPAQCRYWNVQLTDELFNTLEKMNRNHQSALNGHYARLDADGKFRAVISAQDPGVPNWLDTEGYRRGAIFGRWLQCSGNPVPTLKKVKVSEVRQHLPADTPVVSPQAREEALRLKRENLQMRHRWN